MLLLSGAGLFLANSILTVLLLYFVSPSHRRSILFRLTGNRHFAASMTPHPRDLPIRRALMYSDWEPRSSAAGTGVGDALNIAELDEGNRKLTLRQPLTDLTTGILNGALVSEASDVQYRASDVRGAIYGEFQFNAPSGSETQQIYSTGRRNSPL